MFTARRRSRKENRRRLSNLFIRWTGRFVAELRPIWPNIQVEHCQKILRRTRSLPSLIRLMPLKSKEKQLILIDVRRLLVIQTRFSLPEFDIRLQKLILTLHPFVVRLGAGSDEAKAFANELYVTIERATSRGINHREEIIIHPSNEITRAIPPAIPPLTPVNDHPVVVPPTVNSPVLNPPVLNSAVFMNLLDNLPFYLMDAVANPSPITRSRLITLLDGVAAQLLILGDPPGRVIQVPMGFNI
ncbi:hypothetical protein [Fontibacillus sp. BL9]|uniref:hypothetical protein n=1 Tax=Fontibacillus sp. BL9 TaxID=3389971 RepID=UPI00397D94DA